MFFMLLFQHEDKIDATFPVQILENSWDHGNSLEDTPVNENTIQFFE